MGLPKSSGSQWKKWDLHLHSPGTKKSDSYTFPSGDVWDEYCRILHESDVHAFGVTDYFSADGYFNSRDEYRKRYSTSKKRFFANIELCLNVVVNKDNDYINIHIIFNPQVPDDRLRTFLSRLKTSKTRDGSPVYASELSGTADYNEATTTKESIEEAIKNTFGSGERLDDLLIIPAVNNDGIRPKSGVARREVVSIELERISHAFFGNSKNTEHYLQGDRWGDDVNAPARAVLGGSDAHSFEDLRECLGKTVFRNGNIYKQETWIKADVTYEGLKQIVFEPEGRAVIGTEPELHSRLKAKPRRYIKSLALDQIAAYDARFGTWFQDECIELNPELVAIVGNKGSGKSAITDALGLLGNSHKQWTRSEKPEELFSFLTKEKFLKQNCAANFEGRLNWYSGNPDRALLNARTDVNRSEEIEYLPQKYLEKICANIDDSEFRDKLNEVIFGYVKPNETYGKENLDDLIEYRTDQANADIRKAMQVLHEHNKAVVHLERKLTSAYVADIQSKIQAAQSDLTAHIANRPDPVAPPLTDDPEATTIVAEVTEIEKKSETFRSNRSSLAEEQARLTKLVEDLQQAKQAIERPIAELKTLDERFKALFSGVGLDFRGLVLITFDAGPLDRVIETTQGRIDEISPSLATIDDLELEELIGESQLALDKARDVSIDWQLRALDYRRATLIEGLNKPSRDYQTYLAQEQAWKTRRVEIEGADIDPAEQTLNWLRQEEARISQTYPAELQTKRLLRVEASTTIFSLKKDLLTFYNAIKEDIDREIQSHSKELGGYNISIESDLTLRGDFSEEFFRFITQQRKGSFYGSQDGKAELAQIFEAVPDWRREDVAFAALDTIIDRVDFDARSESDVSGNRPRRDVFEQMKQGRDPVEFYDFLFGLSYLEPVYDLKVDGKTLTELSPGERGGVLLVFYLMLDKRDIPLVIDQPEDNLDNKSVYEILVKFLKQAKKRRQIIIATHNANLAVVADAEQIINVRIDKTGGSNRKNDFEFASGAIEDLQINRIVVDILEGTPPAFDNRRLKYRQQNP